MKALEKFKEDNAEEVLKNWGSVEAFEKLIAKVKEKESEVAKRAIRIYGSVEKFTEAMKDNLEHFQREWIKLRMRKKSMMPIWKKAGPYERIGFESFC